MQNNLCEFSDRLGNIMDGGICVRGDGIDCQSHVIDEISFHIASNNSYFVKGIGFNLLRLKQQHCQLGFDYTISDGSARSALLIAEMIREKKQRTLMVVIASAALLNMLSLTITPKYSDKVVFIATNTCHSALLTQITDAPDTMWARRDKYFPKGTLAALSSREKRICYYLFRGYTPKMIGAILGINIKTVSSHRVSVMKKIGCTNKIGLYKTLRVYYGASVEG